MTLPALLPLLRAGLCALVLAAAAPALAGPVSSFQLDNGLEVVVIEDHRAPVAVQMLWYRAGAADAPPGKSGVAHFLEHLMFKGTEAYGPGEFSRIVAENGGTDNAFTGQDYTAYYQRIAADRLELVMQMEADRMRGLRLDAQDVATERDVILEERAQRTDSEPSALFRERMNATAWLHHPYGTPVIGWRAEIEALDRAAALAFYRRFYAPDNAVLVIAGDVRPNEVHALAERFYGPIAPTGGLGVRKRPAEPAHLAARRLLLADTRVAQPYMMRMYLAPARKPGAQEEAAALTYLAEILGGTGATSVLGRALEFDQKLAVYTGAGYSGTALDGTLFSLVVAPRAGVSLNEAEAAMDARLAQFLDEGIDPEQFARVAKRLQAQEIYALDDVQTQAERYGAALATGLTIADVQAWPEVLARVTPEQVLKAARRLLVAHNSVTGQLVSAEGGK